MLSQATSVLDGVASGGTQLSDRMQARIDRMSKYVSLSYDHVYFTDASAERGLNQR